MITFEMIFNHNITFDTNGEDVVYNKEEQDIVLREFSIFPSLDIKKMEVIAKYNGDATEAIKAAVKKVRTPPGGPVRKNAAKPVQVVGEKTSEEPNINNKKRSFNIITNRLKVSKQFPITSNSSFFEFEFNPKEITKFINYVESKKIKIFIDGEEIKPKSEIDFLKEVIPTVQAKIYLK